MKRQRGAALMVILMVLGAAAAYFAISAINRGGNNERNRINERALAQAREALIAWSANNVGTRHGLLPLPDLGSSRNGTPLEGSAAGAAAGIQKNMTVIGRLPWRTLGIAPLRDAAGECLWYAVSGSTQNTVPPDVVNWDAIGHLDLYQSNGTAAATLSLSGTNYHRRPVAVVFAPGPALANQNRQRSATDTVDECGGNYDARNYLDPDAALPQLSGITNYLGGLHAATGFAYALNNTSDLFAAPLPDAQLNGTAPPPGGAVRLLSGRIPVGGAERVNDHAIAITQDDLFRSIAKHADFKTAIGDLTTQLVACLQAAGLPTASGPLGTDGIKATCFAGTPARQDWFNNFLYSKPAGGVAVRTCPLDPVTRKVDCTAAPPAQVCDAALVFAGQRTPSQQRATATQRANVANYLEAENNVTNFPGSVSASLAGLADYDKRSPSADIVRCLKLTAPPPPLAFSFASDLARFVPAGNGVTVGAAPPSLTMVNPGGGTGGCLWWPDPLPLKGRVVRAYFRAQFAQADPAGGADRGNGITLQLVRGNNGSPATLCGQAGNMGALVATQFPERLWADRSLIFETDVHEDNSDGDPAGNHGAILLNGFLGHATTPTAACNASRGDCAFTPQNALEESPTPLAAGQRIEIRSGCDASCGSCTTPIDPNPPNNHVRIRVWPMCNAAPCSDLSADAVSTPSMQRCVALDPALDNAYLALTGGFRAGAGNGQGVVITDFSLRAE